MNRIICVFALLPLIISCSTSDSSSRSFQNIDTLNAPSLDYNNTSKESEQQVAKTNKVIQKEQILGAWTDGKFENATFDIQQDSIFYTDEMVAYPYTLKGDSLTIRYPDMRFKGVVYFFKDTLVLSDPGFGTTKYYRFKD